LYVPQQSVVVHVYSVSRPDVAQEKLLSQENVLAQARLLSTRVFRLAADRVSLFPT